MGANGPVDPLRNLPTCFAEVQVCPYGVFTAYRHHGIVQSRRLRILFFSYRSTSDLVPRRNQTGLFQLRQCMSFAICIACSSVSPFSYFTKMVYCAAGRMVCIHYWRSFDFYFHSDFSSLAFMGALFRSATG